MTDSGLYKKNILEHYKNPRNFSKLKNYNKSASLSNITCGDEMMVFLNVQGDIVKEISFQGSGCAISLAAMSMLSEKVKGEKVKDIQKIQDKEVLDMLGMQKETPRINCGLLGIQTLRKALTT
jgi:nitrogen fixation protein NifU and related proteins